jgi:hypothetical protein
LKKSWKKGVESFYVRRMSKVKQDEAHTNLFSSHWFKNNIEVMFVQMFHKQQNANKFFSLKLKIKKVEKRCKNIFYRKNVESETRWKTQQPPFWSLTWKQHRNDVCTNVLQTTKCKTIF